MVWFAFSTILLVCADSAEEVPPDRLLEGSFVRCEADGRRNIDMSAAALLQQRVHVVLVCSFPSSLSGGETICNVSF